MESILVQADPAISDNNGDTVVLDIESLLAQAASDRSPKMTRALSRKWSYRAEKWSTGVEEENVDELGKRSSIKGLVNSQLEALKQLNKAAPTSPPSCVPVNLVDSAESRNKRFSRFMSINPRKILFIFATASSMGTLILIYCTLAISRMGH